MTEQETIDDYRRVEAFLADPAVKRAFEKVKGFVEARLSDATTDAQALDAWRLSRALDMVATELVRTMDAGKIALQQMQQKEQQERARAARAPRKP